MFDISLVRFIPKKPNVPFLKARHIAVALSVLAIIGSITLFFTRGLNYGIDFTGGVTMEANLGEEPDTIAIDGLLAERGYESRTVQIIQPAPSDDVDYNYVLISIGKQAGEGAEGERAQQEARDDIQAMLVEAYPDADPATLIRNVEVIGGKVSGELTRAGILAVILAMVMVLIYITLRFDWQFALGAVLALVHDVILTIGFFSLTQIEFNLSIVAAILTIVGYSLNDTVIVYDRIRENLRKYKKSALPEVLNLSINDTLSRTIMTSMTTLTALFILFFFGGPGLQGFSDAMIWGVIVGTYSSIFVASPLLLLLGVNRYGEAKKADLATTS